ncbi:MAG: hypothetical protein L6Q78_14210, partial [Bacteroidia bacterium]|nr:hypothetical protein [Bacteroidia bacterium]
HKIINLEPMNLSLSTHIKLPKVQFNKQFCVMLAGRCVLNFCTHLNFRLNVKHSFSKYQHERKAGRTLGATLKDVTSDNNEQKNTDKNTNASQN